MKNIRTLFMLMSFMMIAFGANAQEQSLQNALNPDGTLRAGANGSYNTQGYTMTYGANGAPVFVPQTQSSISGFWDTQIGQPGLNNVVFALAVSGDNVFVGGSFTTAGGSGANRVARYNLTTNTWSSLGTGVNNGVDGGVLALVVSGDNVFVGGSFTQAGGATANRVARYNLTTNTWSSLGTGTNNGVSGGNFVYALAVFGDNVIVGGEFTTAGSIVANRVARFNLTTNTWSSLGTGAQNGVNGTIRALAVLGDNVFVGGGFLSAGNQSARYVASYNLTSDTWSVLGTSQNNGVSSLGIPVVNALAVSGDNVFVGGDFTGAGFVTANRVARYNVTTNTWHSLSNSTANGVNGVVRALFVSGDSVWVGGGFTAAGGETANRVACFNLATNTWSSLGTGTNNGVNNTVYALAVSGVNVLVGGELIVAGDLTSTRIAYFRRNPSINIASLANISSTSLTVNGTINPNGLPLSLARFEYSLDPTFATGVSNVNTIPNAAAIGSGTSPVPVSATIPLSPNSVIFMRLRATNIGGTSVSLFTSFTNVSPSPLPTAGLQLWLRADSLVTETGGVISQWNDLSGNNRHAFSMGVARPTLTSSTLFFNSRPVIDFGPNGDKQLGFQRIGDTRTAFIVGRSTSFSSVNQFLLGDSTTFDFHPGSTAGTSSRLVDPSFASANVRNGLVFLNGQQFAPTAAVRPSSPTIIMFETTGNAETSTIARDRNLNARGWRGVITEVIVYNRVLSVAERAQVQSYLAGRYDIGLQTSANPSVVANNFGTFVLGSTGVTVTFTTASTTAGSLSGSVTNARPSVVGALPTGIVNLAERFWTINQTGLTGFTCALTFDLSTLGGVQNFNNLKVLRRNNSSSPWVDVETLPGVTISRSAPFITVAGLTSFSDFTIGSDASNQLPVELTEFGFRKTDSGIELHWRTATELNNSGFEVERKSQGADWNTLGFVRGNGTTTEAQSYSFLDRTASGKVQYRLKQLDFNGQFEYSNVIEVDAGLPKQFALEQNYPNPFNPTTIISYQLPVAGNVSLKLYDVLGREVMTLVNGRQEAGVYNLSLNASSLSSGVYFYRLQSGSFVQTKKMMLVK